MCGITGIYNTRNKQKIDKNILLQMTNTLIHRGPDDSGFFIQDNLGFGFRRLSIIDLNTGNQPMFNEDKSIVSICNGEIYNFQELKKELQSKGHVFYTNCDSEILVHLYEENGLDFIKLLNGQFALALFDKLQQKLILARDHFGIAPLFYTFKDGLLIFGSEIKAIINHPLVSKEVDLSGLDQIFSFPGLISPQTMFKNIYSLKPGHCIILKDSELLVKEYWDLIYPKDSQAEYNLTENEYIEKLDELLMQSVKYRLISDVPVGFYLSGGLDSSMIASLIHNICPHEKRHSFSIGFHEEDIDETRYQQMISRHVNSIHHEILFEWTDISKRFKNMIFHAECPVKESYNTCSLALSELVKKNNIKVILTGEGADELFAGYVGYRFDNEGSRTGDDFDPISQAYEEEENQKLWGDQNFFYEIRQYELKEIKNAIYSENLRNCFNDFDSVQENLVDKSKLENRHPIHKRSYLDFKLRLADHLLSDHGDRLAYANSIEARYPFLDINVVEFARTIPPKLKLNGLIEKYILKKIAEKYLPKEISNREKFGFVAPGSTYIMNRSIEWVNDILSYDTIKRQGYFDPNTVERLKKMYLSKNFRLNLPFENDLLMIVFSFGAFLEVFELN